MQKPPKAEEDSWAFQPIGAPFPEAPVRVPGQQNQYVALWYKHGKPIHGRAWNNDGVVQCSLPYKGAELTTKLQLEGQIQILQYKGDFKILGFWYEWLPVKQRHEDGNRELVKCGKSTPLLIRCSDQQHRVGYLDLDTEIALVSYNNKTEKYEGGMTDNFFAIFRNFSPPPVVKIYEDLWVDVRYNDNFPKNALLAEDRPLKTETGAMMKQYIGLWYKHGDAVFGRAYPDQSGKVRAHFGKNNQETAGPEVGSMQILTLPEENLRGIEYKWMTTKEGMTSGDWTMVKTGQSAPCVLRDAKGVEMVANLDLKTNRASAGYGGVEKARRTV
ncbi:unnamed protein product [Caenorhabditis auriculariae]|uniref:Uncharacterized protein n=1 Tax=Caenorhabditis auriculariae TaxID=2777116 RepID=A0A8S1HK77_9PELO|nr:unnamed protein product [Caenorhabditis auriculariae]